MDACTRETAEGEEGNVQATVSRMTEAEAQEIIEKIVSLFSDIAALNSQP